MTITLGKLNLQLHAEGKTKLENMVNPQVMADMISAELPAKLKFAPIAKVDSTLVGQAGDTITIPSYKYIGEADDLSEGIAMGTVKLESAVVDAQIKEAGKAVEITDKAVNSGYGDPIGEGKSQIGKSIADKVDSDCVAALAGATLVLDKSSDAISYTNVVQAIDLFQEEDDEVKILYIHPLQKGQIRLDPQFLANVPNLVTKGAIGELAGCEVVASNKIKEVGGVYPNYIVQTTVEGDEAPALAIYLKEKANIEMDRDILGRSTVVAASEYYVAELANDSKVVKLNTKAGVTTIATAAVAGVTAPAKGGTPVPIATATSAYTGTVTWSPAVAETFLGETVYTATITLAPKAGYHLVGVAEDFFTIAGATATNDANSGVITAVFPATEA